MSKKPANPAAPEAVELTDKDLDQVAGGYYDASSPYLVKKGPKDKSAIPYQDGHDFMSRESDSKSGKLERKRPG